MKVTLRHLGTALAAASAVLVPASLTHAGKQLPPPAADAVASCDAGEGFITVTIVGIEGSWDFDIDIDGTEVDGEVLADEYTYGPYADGEYLVTVDWVQGPELGENLILDEVVTVDCVSDTVPPDTTPDTTPATEPAATETTATGGSGGAIPETGGGAGTIAVLAGGLLAGGTALLVLRRPRRA